MLAACARSFSLALRLLTASNRYKFNVLVTEHNEIRDNNFEDRIYRDASGLTLNVSNTF